MSETSGSMKVYDLAKELGLESIALVDKLKDLKIDVKSHMSTIEGADVEKAREALGKKAPTTKKKTVGTTKKAVVKKRAAAVVRKSDAEEKKVVTRTTKKKAAQAGAIIIRKADGSSEASPTKIKSQRTKKEEAAAEALKDAEAEAAEIQSQIEESIQTSSETPGAASPRKSFLRTTTLAANSKLRIVEEPKESKFAKRAPKAPPKPGEVPDPNDLHPKKKFRAVVDKENLDKMVEEEAAKKKGGLGKGEKAPEDVNFSDYRKKEVIFLPRKKRIPVGKEMAKTEITEAAAHKRVVEVNHTITVSELANSLHIKGSEIIKKLMQMGQMATLNQALDLDTATLIAHEYKYEVKDVSFDEKEILKVEEDKPEDLESRPPIVTIMGHVDHGKTSLLDAIKETNVVEGEAGGITQHIGAYTVEKDGKKITFIDTPGHEAFSVMRARGANVTDIVILVVAADDGVMPQTREALAHAKQAGVPIIVAVNKMDKEGANPERVKQALAELDLLAEDWGGDAMFIPVSALKKTGLSELLEAINLNAEVLDLKSNPNARAQGHVLEARLEKGRGPVATLLVKKGKLQVGDTVVAGVYSGRIRAMMDHLGQQVKEVSPGMAVEILGLEGVPNAGDHFDQVSSDVDAKTLVSHRKEEEKVRSAGSARMSLDDLFSKVQAGNVKELKVVLKADVFGSLEAVKDTLTKASTEKVKVNVIHAATGGVTESDILLAAASNAVIIGFNVRPETKARKLAESENIEIKCYNIIYELVDDVKKAMAGLLDKKKVEKFLGRAEVRQTFSVPKAGVIAGSAVIDGKMIRGANVRLLRDSRVIYEGKMNSLKRFKDDAKEVQTGYECGIGIEGYNDIKNGDIIEAYEIELISQDL